MPPWGTSNEYPQQGTSNEYPQHMFSLRNKKNIIWIPSLIWSHDYDSVNRKNKQKKNSFCFKSHMCSVFRKDHQTMQYMWKLVAKILRKQDGFIMVSHKRGYPHNIFFITPQRHILLVLIRRASVRHSNENHNICIRASVRHLNENHNIIMFLWRTNKYISTFHLKKVPYLELCTVSIIPSPRYWGNSSR